MAKKRKAGVTSSDVSIPVKTKFDVNERFDDSEDDFYTGRDKILLDAEPASKRRKRLEEQEKDLQPSDEEVLRYESDDNDTEEDSVEDGDRATDGEEEEDEHGDNWGTSKADYYNADVLETEADALEEEAEARRLQQKQLKSMSEADFGFDETVWTNKEQSAIRAGPVVEKLPDTKIPETATKEEKLEILKSRYPEFQPLARDFVDLQKLWMEFNAQARTHDKEQNATTLAKLQALSTYLGSIAMYFAVLTSDCKPKTELGQITSLPPNELRDHGVIENLMKSRQIWDDSKHLSFTSTKSDKAKEDVVIVQEKIHNAKAAANVLVPEKKARVVKATKETNGTAKPAKKKREKSKLLDLQALLSQPSVTQEDQSDFGDEAPLTVEEAAEKAKKKKSLRFYTSQIAQKANKRGAASRDAGGDDDVPRKERLRDRQERLLKDAEKRGQQKATGKEELGGDDDDDASIDMGAGDEYYQSLVAQNSIKKAAKQARADAYAEAARKGGQVFEAEQVGPDGKRAITYAIEKNKGLMPKRKKDVRNPRVKKRKKYEEKKKKLGSMRQVYKGGQKGAYGGEATGIKTNIVKSVKL